MCRLSRFKILGEKRKTAKVFCLLLLLSSKVHISEPRPCQSQPNGMVNIPTSDSVLIKLLQHSRAGRHKTRASQNKRTAWLFIRSADTTVGRLVLSLFWQDGQKPGDQHLANSHRTMRHVFSIIGSQKCYRDADAAKTKYNDGQITTGSAVSGFSDFPEWNRCVGRIFV